MDQGREDPFRSPRMGRGLLPPSSSSCGPRVLSWRGQVGHGRSWEACCLPLVPPLSRGVADPWEQAEPGCQRSTEHQEGRLPLAECGQRWKAGLGPVLQLAMLDPPAPGKAAVRRQGALQVDARVRHLHVIVHGLPILGHQAEGCGRDLGAEQTSGPETVARGSEAASKCQAGVS